MTGHMDINAIGHKRENNRIEERSKPEEAAGGPTDGGEDTLLNPGNVTLSGYYSWVRPDHLTGLRLRLLKEGG